MKQFLISSNGRTIMCVDKIKSFHLHKLVGASLWDLNVCMDYTPDEAGCYTLGTFTSVENATIELDHIIEYINRPNSPAKYYIHDDITQKS
jgi:hypothetical protein